MNSLHGKDGIVGQSDSSTDLLVRVFEHMPVAIIIVNHRGGITMANLEAEKVFGYSRGELIGVQVEKLLPARYQSSHSHYRNRFFAEPHARPMGAGRDLY